jgi:hypothetical protein
MTTFVSLTKPSAVQVKTNRPTPRLSTRSEVQTAALSTTAFSSTSTMWLLLRRAAAFRLKSFALLFPPDLKIVTELTYPRATSHPEHSEEADLSTNPFPDRSLSVDSEGRHDARYPRTSVFDSRERIKKSGIHLRRSVQLHKSRSSDAALNRADYKS